MLARLEARGIASLGRSRSLHAHQAAVVRPGGLAAERRPRSTRSWPIASPDAYEQLVDRLLDSPRFGERWGRHWLDMARYADSDGYEKDNPRPDAWRYRDWVIDAVNADMPLDRFTIEQLAGDLLPGATADERLATAFHRQTLTNTEGGTDQEQFRVEAIFDRVATTGSVWLGLTVGCAQCHTHKYDPITHQEYYQLFAFFNNGDETETDVPLVGETLDKCEQGDRRRRSKAGQAGAEARQAREPRSPPSCPRGKSQLKSAAATPLEFHPIELVSARVAAQGRDQDPVRRFVSGQRARIPTSTSTRSWPRPTWPRRSPAFASRRSRTIRSAVAGPGRTEHGNFVLGEFRAFAAPIGGDQDRQSRRDCAGRGRFLSARVSRGQRHRRQGTHRLGRSCRKTGRDHWIMFTTKQPLERPQERPGCNWC